MRWHLNQLYVLCNASNRPSGEMLDTKCSMRIQTSRHRTQCNFFRCQDYVLVKVVGVYNEVKLTDADEDDAQCD